MTCQLCDGELDRKGGRGLCHRCYENARRAGDLIDYERTLRRPADVIDDYRLLSSDGLSDDQIARRLGYSSAEGLRKTLRRHGEPYRSRKASSA